MLHFVYLLTSYLYKRLSHFCRTGDYLQTKKNRDLSFDGKMFGMKDFLKNGWRSFRAISLILSLICQIQLQNSRQILGGNLLPCPIKLLLVIFIKIIAEIGVTHRLTMYSRKCTIFSERARLLFIYSELDVKHCN